MAAADAAFAEAATQAEGADARLVVAARIWQAAARTDAGQLTSAESLCRAVLVTASSDDGEWLRAEATLARVLLWQGRTAEAAALPFVRHQQPSRPPFVEATAIRVLVEANDLFEAGRRARDLLERPADGDRLTRVVALGAHLRVLLSIGDLSLAEAQLRAAAAAARAARTPLRLARMRLLWCQALRRAGRISDGDRELRMLVRMRSAMPPLLRSAIDRSSKSPGLSTTSGPPGPSMVPGGAVDLVVLAQREGGDREALARVGDFLLRGVRASRVDFWTADAGPATAVVSSGAGLPTQLGRRALEAGIVIGPEVVESGWETAAPVRLGSHLIGALAVRWPADRSSPVESATVLNLACAVAAPRLESLTHAARQVTQAAIAIPELIGVSDAIADVREPSCARRRRRFPC